MIKKHPIYKQYKLRTFFEKQITIKYIKKIIDLDPFLPKELYYDLKNQGRSYSISRTHTCCRFTGRSKANLNKYRISRMVFRKYGEDGYLNGLKKASW